MEVSIQVIFLVTYPMGREILNMLIKTSLLVSLSRGRSREEGLTILVKALFLMDFGRTMKKFREL
jgi:hypothetical protein